MANDLDPKILPPVLEYWNRTVELTRNDMARFACAVLHSMAVGFLGGGGFCLGVVSVALIAAWAGHLVGGHAVSTLFNTSIQFVAAGAAFGAVVGGLYGAAAQFN